MNMVTAKYNAQYAPDGILFFGISPGVVNTSEGNVGMFMPIFMVPLMKPPLTFR
jgi:hypothetical protein